LRFQRQLATDDAVIAAELSADLETWAGGAGAVEFVGHERTSPTTEHLVFRSVNPASAQEREFGRIRVQSR
jgi:hypothetical protein